MTIRRLTERDVPAVVEMGLRFLASPEYRTYFTGDASRLEILIRMGVGSEGMASWVAEHEDGTLVGMLGVVVFNHPMSGERVASEIAWWVNPEARGIGMRLLREAERWAKAQGATRLLMVAPNDRVGGFYQRLGFSPVETSYQRSL